MVYSLLFSNIDLGVRQTLGIDLCSYSRWSVSMLRMANPQLKMAPRRRERALSTCLGLLLKPVQPAAAVRTVMLTKQKTQKMSKAVRKFILVLGRRWRVA